MSCRANRSACGGKPCARTTLPPRVVKMSSVSTTPASTRPGSATISRIRLEPSGSTPTCTTRSMQAATVGTTNASVTFSPASSGSVHANSAREAVVKLCTLPLLAGENVTDAFVVPTVASCVDLVVQIGVEPDGSRRVREIVALSGRVESGVVETEDIFTSVDGKLARAQGFPPHQERFENHGFDLAAILSERGQGSASI